MLTIACPLCGADLETPESYEVSTEACRSCGFVAAGEFEEMSAAKAQVVPSPPRLPQPDESGPAGGPSLESLHAHLSRFNECVRATIFKLFQPVLCRIVRFFDPSESTHPADGEGSLDPDFSDNMNHDRLNGSSEVHRCVPSPPQLPAPADTTSRLNAMFVLVAGHLAMAVQRSMKRFCAPIERLRTRFALRSGRVIEAWLEAEPTKRDDTLRLIRGDVPSPPRLPQQVDQTELAQTWELYWAEAVSFSTRRSGGRQGIVRHIKRAIAIRLSRWFLEPTEGRGTDSDVAGETSTISAEGDSVGESSRAFAGLHLPRPSAAENELGETLKSIAERGGQSLFRLGDRMRTVGASAHATTAIHVDRWIAAGLHDFDEEKLAQRKSETSEARSSTDEPISSPVPSPPYLPQPKVVDGVKWRTVELLCVSLMIRLRPGLKWLVEKSRPCWAPPLTWVRRRWPESWTGFGLRPSAKSATDAMPVPKPFGVAAPFHLPTPKRTIGSSFERIEFVIFSVAIALVLCFFSLVVLPARQEAARGRYYAQIHANLTGDRLPLSVANPVSRPAANPGFAGVSGVLWGMFRGVTNMFGGFGLLEWVMVCGVLLLFNVMFSASYGARGP